MLFLSAVDLTLQAANSTLLLSFIFKIVKYETTMAAYQLFL